MQYERSERLARRLRDGAGSWRARGARGPRRRTSAAAQLRVCANRGALAMADERNMNAI